MTKKTISFRIPPDTHDRFEEYREQRSSGEDKLSKADAGRRLLETGLEVEAQDTSNQRGQSESSGGRPSGVIGSLLHDARQSRGTHLGIALILLTLHFGLALPPLVDLALLAVSGAYALSAVFGYVEVGRARFDPDPAETDEATPDHTDNHST